MGRHEECAVELSPVQKRIVEAFAGIARRTPRQQITVKGVCREAGISRTTFYAQFSGLDALVELIEYGTMQDMRQIFRDFEYIDLDRVRKSGKPIPMHSRVYEYMEQNWDTFLWLFGEYGDEGFRVAWREQNREFFGRIAEGQLDDESSIIFQSLCNGMVERLTLDWFDGIFEASADRMANLATNAVLAIFDELKGK